MKERYIRRVRRNLRVSAAQKAEVLADLEQLFSEARARGESEAAVIGRLGDAAEYARAVGEELGMVRKPVLRLQVLLLCVCWGVAVASGVLFAVSRTMRITDGVIGFAQGSTDIRVTGAVDAGVLLLLPPAVAVLLSGVLLVRRILKRKRSRI